MSVVECENALVQGFFDFTTETVNDDDAFRSIMDDDVLKKASQQSMISTSLLVAGASVEQHMLASHHPSVKQKQMKFLLKRLFRNNNILSLFNTNNSSSKVTPFYSFTSSIHYLATIEFSEIMMNLTRRTHDDANESDDMNGFSYRCKYLAELLLGAFQHQDVDAQPAVVDLTRTLLENPGQLVIIIMLYWSLERAHEANALLVQYCVAMISQCSPTHSFTADSDMEQEQARLLLYVQAMQNLQLILTTGRLVMADLGSGDTANTGKSISSGSVSDILFVRSVVSTQCVLDENIVMLLGITVRILLTFSCLRYRYDVVKVILEFNLLSPLDSGKEDDGNDGAASPHPRRRMSSMNHSPGMIALSKYWGMDTLISQLPDLTLPPPPLPPSPTHCIRQSGATPSSFSSSLSPSTPSVTNNDDDEVLLQQHIMNVQMHILQQEEKLVEDPGYQYFVDVCRDDCLHFLSSRPSGTFLLRPHDSGSNSSIYLSFRGQNATGSGPNAGEMKTSHAIIRREKASGDGSSSIPGCGYLYRCGAVGPCNSIDELLREISRLLPAPGLLLNATTTTSSESDSKPQSQGVKMTESAINNTISGSTNINVDGGGIRRVMSTVPVQDSPFEYSSVDPNALLWSHIDVEQKSPKKSSLMWFPGTCLPPSDLISLSLEAYGAATTATAEEDSTGCKSNELRRKPLSAIAHIVQSVLHCLAVKAVYRQLVAYLNAAFSPQNCVESPWNWEHSSARYISRVVAELMIDDFDYYYGGDTSSSSSSSSSSSGGGGCDDKSDEFVNANSDKVADPLEERLKRLSSCCSIDNINSNPKSTSVSVTESIMRQHYITLFAPLLVYVNVTKRHILHELVGKAHAHTAGIDHLFHDSEDTEGPPQQPSDNFNDSGDGSGVSSGGSEGAMVAQSPPLLSLPRPPPVLLPRNFLTNHVLYRFNPNLDSWSAKLNALTELELGECVAALIFEHCVSKPVKIMHSTAPHRVHESSLLAPGVAINDACAWLGIHLGGSCTRDKRSTIKESAAATIPSAIGLVVVTYCEKYALRAYSKKPHAAIVAVPLSGRKKRRSKSGSHSNPASPRTGRSGGGTAEAEVETCTPMMVINWLESMCVINVVIKPGDTFTAAQKYIRYIDPWAVEPLYEHLTQTQKTSIKGTSASVGGKSTLGRSSYTPIVYSRPQKSNTNMHAPVAADVKASKKFPDAPTRTLSPTIRSMVGLNGTGSVTVTTNTDDAFPGPEATTGSSCRSSSNSANRRLNIAELVMSAFMHRIIDSVDIQKDDDPNSSNSDGTSDVSSLSTGAADTDDFLNGDAEEAVLQYFRLQSDELEQDVGNGNGSGLPTPSFNSNSLSFKTVPGVLITESSKADTVDSSSYTTEPRACYCYSFLNLWVGVNGEEWLSKCIDNLTVFHSALMSNTSVDSESSGAGDNVGPIGTASGALPVTANPLLQAPISPYHMSISNNLYRNSIFHELWMAPRYIATIKVDLKSLKDISYRGKEISSLGQWGSASSGVAPKDMDIYAVVRLIPATKALSKAHITGTGAASDLVKSNSSVSTSTSTRSSTSSSPFPRSSSSSPIPGGQSGDCTPCIIDPIHMLDTYVSPTHKVTCSQHQSQQQSSSAYGQQSSGGLLASGGAEGANHSAEFIWDEQIAFRFPLPQQSYHINSLNPNHLATPEGELLRDNYLNKLYEAPAILSIAIYQKAFSFTSALTGSNATSSPSQHDSKLGEVEVPLDSLSDGHGNPMVSDWYPLSQSSAVDNSYVSRSAPKTTGIWLLYLQLQLNYILMAGSE